ncbi:hypothetical protein Salat_2249300 [Sesamum alatum]|uniref:Uncharacterized protein n=1 Tax=Sesamum alatum TaxID=300844 RepID=A0AAE1XVJ1_9LAMI|nr:hypothetical protein Salat_2249300 [Sesamum alatum]
MRSAKTIVVITALLLLVSMKPSCEATRMLDEEEQQWMKREERLVLPSLQRGRPMGPPSPNGCTWIPGGGGKPCTATSIGQRNFAVVASRPPPPARAGNDAYPEQMVQFGVASGSK